MNKIYQKNINKYVSKLKSNGFLIIKNLVTDNKCRLLKSEL